MRRILHDLIFLFIFFILLSAEKSFAQSPPVKLWDKTFGGNSSDNLQSLIVTSDGGYLLGGASLSGVAGDKAALPQGNTDFWIVKTDANGNKLWDKVFGGYGIDYLQSAVAATDGGYLLGGYSDSPLSGGKTQASRGGRDFWIVKIDASGNKQWDKTFGGSGDDELRTLIAAADGGYLLGGISSSGISGDKTQNNYWLDDYWVVKIDANGNKQWDKNFGGGDYDWLTSLALTPDGGYLLGGRSGSGISGDKTVAPRGSSDYWVIRIDASGNKQWDKIYGGNEFDELNAIAPATDGGFLLGGCSYSSVSGDKTQPSLGYQDYWVVKIDASGNRQWDKTFGGWSRDDLQELIATPDGGYLLGGYSYSDISGDKTQYSRGGTDYWVVKTDGSGNKQWDRTYGGYDYEYLNALAATPDGSFLLGGYSFYGISGDRTQASRGSSDYWLLKITPLATGFLSPGSLCAGSPMNIPFVVSGAVNGSNVFTAQLSDASGSFAAPVTIGTLAGTTSGTIQATIPAGTAAGSGYRIRVVGGNPVIYGADNGSNLSITAPPLAQINGAPAICQNTTLSLTATAVSGASYAWTGPNGFTATTQTIGINNVSGAHAGTYTLTVATTNGCSASTSSNVIVNQPVTPSVGITATATNIIYGTSVTFTASPVNGGTSPAWQWKKNGVNIAGATASVYTTNSLANNDVITAVLTSNASCATTATAASNGITVTVLMPSITAGGVLNGFIQTVVAPSLAQSITVAGSNLAGNVTITPPAGFEVSANGGTSWFTNSNPLVLVPVNNAVASTTLMVRLNAATVGTYSGNITAAGTGITTVLSFVNGTTYQRLGFSMIANLNSFSQTIGTPSAIQSYTLYGSNLVDNVVVTASDGYQLSLDQINWSTALTLSPVNGTVGKTIYIRMNAGTAGTYNGSIRTTSTGFLTMVSPLNGTAVMPQPVLSTGSGLPGPFAQVTGTPSPVQTFTISGSHLTGEVVLTAPAGYELSSDGTAWSNRVSLIPVNGTVTAVIISVRLNASATGFYNGTIALTSPGSNTIDIMVNGTAASVSTLTAGPNPAAQEVSRINIFHPFLNAPGTLTVYNSFGMKLASYTVQPGTLSTSLNVQNLPAGTYLIVLRDGNTKRSVRLIRF